MGTTTFPPSGLQSLHHAAFRCRDAEQTRWFYEDVMGLKASAGIVLDEVPGSGDPVPYMHIFFEMEDGNFVAFFDAPSTADPSWFKRKDSFDMHIALQARDEAHMLEIQQRIRSHGVSCLGPVEHHFVRSVYMYDPNGIQVEVTCRTADHDRILAEEGAALPQLLKDWTAQTRAEKEAKFGAESLDRRGKPQSELKG